MRAFAFKQLQVIPVLLMVTLATTLMLNLAPGDPARLILGDEAEAAQVERLRDQLGLNDPLATRYVDWLGGVVRGDFGRSLRTQEPVLDAIGNRYAVTLELALLAMLMALAMAIPAGMVAAYRAGRAFDKCANALGSVMLAAPNFMSGLFLAYVFSVRLRVFPVTGWVPLSESISGNLRHAFLPSFTLALGIAAIFYRLVRSDMQGILREEYIAAAFARGLSAPYVLVRHALKPASFSLLTLAGITLSALMGGTVIVEQLFGLPGIGSLLLQAILSKDLATVQGVVLFVCIVYVLVNAVVDVLYATLDPRVRSAV